MILQSQNNNSSRTYPTCRICFGTDEPKSLIAPCKCKGTVKYVHRTCLAQWRRRSNGRSQESERCTLCKFHYIIKRNSKFGNFITLSGVRFVITCVIILIVLFPSGYIMKLLMSLTSKIYLRDSEINYTTSTSTSIILWKSYHLPFCSTLTKSATTIISKDFYQLISIIMDKDFWFRVMCNDIIQHLHLGLFLIGSASNIATAYFMLNELLELFDNHHQQIQENFGGGGGENQTKKIILRGSFVIVIGVWIYYSLSPFSAFKVATTQEFLQELPLWIIRWVTISMAIVDFGLRIYWQIKKINFNDGEVLSIQKLDFNTL